MFTKWLLIPMLLGICAPVFSQTASTSPAYTSPDPMVNISLELTKISRSVTTLSDHLKDFVAKFEKVGGTTFDEKQQKLVLGMELLVRAEQRVATLQKFQIEMVEKQNETRSKLTQTETDLRPRNIDRSVIFEGTTETEELRDARRTRLQADRISLSQLLQQIQSNLQETTESLKEAQTMVVRLRKQILPDIEREFYDR